jgi:hypothetical protein
MRLRFHQKSAKYEYNLRVLIAKMVVLKFHFVPNELLETILDDGDVRVSQEGMKNWLKIMDSATIDLKHDLLRKAVALVV